MSMSYSDLIPVLIRAIQEQDAKIESLKGRSPQTRASAAGKSTDSWLTWIAVALGGMAFVSSVGIGAIAYKRTARAR